MKLRFTMALALAVFVGAGFPVVSEAGAQSTADSAAVAKVVEDYHAALSSGDSAKALALLSADAVILEGGRMETRAEYRSHHLASDIAFSKSVKSDRTPVVVRVSGDLAWTSSTSIAEGTFNGRAISTSGAESMVLKKTPGGWRIVSIHWSSRTRRPPAS